MTPDRLRKLEADLSKARSKLASARAERDLMKAVAEGLHLKVLDLEARLSPPASAPASSESDPGDPEVPEVLTESDTKNDVVAELGEAQARADRLAARLDELRLQISVFAPEGDEAQARAREASDQLRKMNERIQILERQLANARVREESLTSQIVRLES